MPGTVPGAETSKPIEAERLHWDISKPNGGVVVRGVRSGGWAPRGSQANPLQQCCVLRKIYRCTLPGGRGGAREEKYGWEEGGWILPGWEGVGLKEKKTVSRVSTKGMSAETAVFHCALCPHILLGYMVLAPNIDTNIISSLQLRKLRLRN